MGGRKPIVVADDDRSLRLLCRVNLELDGYEVVEAADGRELEAVGEGHDVALVILDVHFGLPTEQRSPRGCANSYPELSIAFLTGSVAAW